MKNVIITGCSRGIGYATAKVFLENGFKVIGTSTTGEIEINNENFEGIKLEIDDDQSITDFAEYVKASYGKVDFLINNAAILLEDWDVAEVDILSLRKTFDVNVIGLVNLTEHIIPLINEGGHIINISSGWGSFSELGFHEFVPHYKMSKASVNMYTKLLSERLKGNKIKVSSLDPGWVKSDMGGQNADREPREAAYDVFNLVNANVKSGLFWANGKIRNW